MKPAKWIGIGALLLLCSVGTTVLAADQYLGFPVVRLLINGKEVKGAVPPIVVEGRTMLPVRDVAEAVGATVAWDEATQTVSLTAERPDVLKQENQKLQERVAALEAETAKLKAANADLKAKLAAAMAPPIRNLLPASAKEVSLTYIVVVTPRNTKTAHNLPTFAVLKKDGDDLYINTSGVGLVLALVADDEEHPADQAPRLLDGVGYQITKVYTDAANPDSPWYSQVTIRHKTNGREVRFDTHGTAYEHAENSIPIPFTLNQLLMMLAMRGTARYDEATRTLTVVRP